MILIVWSIALTITCPPYFGWYDDSKRFSSTLFDCHYNQNKGYVVFSAMGSFFLPMIVMLYVYSKIFFVLISRQHRITKTEVSERAEYEIDPEYLTSEVETSIASPRYMVNSVTQPSFERESPHQTFYELVELRKGRPSIRSLPNTVKLSTAIKQFNSVQFNESQLSISTTGTGTDSMSTTGKFKIHRQGTRIPIRVSSLRRETKTAQTLSMVVGGFIACWLPFFICYLMMPFVPAKTISEGLMATLTWLGWVNSAINPFIYAFYNADFRIAFWRLTCKRLYKKYNKQDLSYLKN